MSEPAVTPAPAVSSLNLRRLSPYLGAEITGVDLRGPLDDAAVAAIAQAHAEHEVLVFPDQRISAEDLKRFGRYFGALSVHPFSTNAEDDPELIVYDNKEGNPPRATDLWHSDEMFRQCPPMGTALCAKVIPELGGDTVFCSMTAAYESLSDKMQQFISGLEAVNDFKIFKTLFGNSAEDRRRLHDYEEAYPQVTHPVVRVHPITGKKAIYVSRSFTVAIKGMEETESAMLLDRLYRLTSLLEIQYRHRWAPDMLVFWDNRAVQHAAVHDYYPARRAMERVTVKGDRPVGTGAAAEGTALRRFKPGAHIPDKDRATRHHDRADRDRD
jgi:taurine dioxygenase